MFGVIFFNSLLSKLYESLRVLFKFKQVTWFIDKVIWLKLHMDDLFNYVENVYKKDAH